MDNESISISNNKIKEEMQQSVAEFTKQNSDYYVEQFNKIQSTTKYPWSWNGFAAIFGPFWAAARGMWGYFWAFLILELFALVQISRGIWSDLGGAVRLRAEKLEANLEKLQQQIQAASTAGENTTGMVSRSEGIQNSIVRLTQEADLLASQSTNLIFIGIGLLICIKIMQGFYANIAYEKQYLKWRSNTSSVLSSFDMSRVFFGLILWLSIIPMTAYRFTSSKPIEWLVNFPIDKEIFTPLTKILDGGFDWLSLNFEDVFDSTVVAIRTLLDGLETIFVATPWPVVVTVILVAAWRLAGVRVAIFTAVAITYLLLLGLWETSMITVSLLGAAATLCIVFGIPLGIWFGKSNKAYNAALPVLDFMQTMPAFVYLIPIIAFFGTGKPPGIIATIIFGMPPVIRLTALGMRGVSENTKEAAIAYGASRWILLKDVELPLAMPSIMTGINQTILMCLSMVVIASLIGADGLGRNVLEALQYAAKGQGLIVGLAILFCAMVIDRIVQGYYKRSIARGN